MTHSLKNNYQLVDSINKLKNITSIIKYDFMDLFNNINLQDLNRITNSLFQDYYFQLQLHNNVDMNYFKTLTNNFNN